MEDRIEQSMASAAKKWEQEQKSRLSNRHRLIISGNGGATTPKSIAMSICSLKNLLSL